MPLFELAAKEVVQRDLLPRPALDEMEDIQVHLRNFPRFANIRHLQAKDVSTLVCVQGICVSAGKVRVKASNLSIMCRNCHITKRLRVNRGFGGARLPRTCDSQAGQGDNPDAAKCPMDPYMILPDSTEYIDQQRLKLQEAPDRVPTGEMPRHISLSADRYLVGNVKPGTRITVVGIYEVFQAHGRQAEKGSSAATIRYPYLRVLGIQADNEASELLAGRFSPEDEEDIHELSRESDLYERISNSIAPAIYGSSDIKKAIACQLFGGARKFLPDGMRLRGDINILLLGDPSTGKSQFLKFAHQIAPIGVYTSGKGSSAAGLTASVIRDPSSGEFQLEGGALVLADGGLVCIDEFDKMRAQDRVAIHEAMEQQTISIAKAGITTILNSRAAVLAAANPVFGRYDDMKSPTDNIDFQSTILSRFDLIFIVRDVRNEKRDKMLANHIINVHQNRDQAINESTEVQGTIPTKRLKKYIAYARARRQPRLTDKASQMLKNHYVQIRSDMKQRTTDMGAQAIPITVRQLEAIVRLSEALARMQLSDEANEEHVREAIRLFNVSTVQAATADFGADGIGADFLEKVRRAEAHLKRRIGIGAQVGYSRVTFELKKASHSDNAVAKAISIMVKRGELQKIHGGKLLKRLR